MLKNIEVNIPWKKKLFPDNYSNMLLKSYSFWTKIVIPHTMWQIKLKSALCISLPTYGIMVSLLLYVFLVCMLVCSLSFKHRQTKSSLSGHSQVTSLIKSQDKHFFSLVQAAEVHASKVSIEKKRRNNIVCFPPKLPHNL